MVSDRVAFSRLDYLLHTLLAPEEMRSHFFLALKHFLLAALDAQQNCTKKNTHHFLILQLRSKLVKQFTYIFYQSRSVKLVPTMILRTVNHAFYNITGMVCSFKVFKLVRKIIKLLPTSTFQESFLSIFDNCK